MFNFGGKRGIGSMHWSAAWRLLPRNISRRRNPAIVTRARHRHSLEETVAALDRAVAEAAKSGAREELIAEELRAAATTLGRLTGRVDVEDILDVIFRDFCIGK